MNLPTLIVLLLVLAALVLALRVLRRSGDSSCGCGSSTGCSGTCTGCPHCQGK